MDSDNDAPPELVNLDEAEVSEGVDEITTRVPITIVTGEKQVCVSVNLSV